MSWRELRDGETDWEFVLGVLWAPLFALSVIAMMVLPGFLVPACGLKRFTGIPCPTCGSYRCMHLLMRGDWWAAVGCYHAPSNAERAARYRERVKRIWSRVTAIG